MKRVVWVGLALATGMTLPSACSAEDDHDDLAGQPSSGSPSASVSASVSPSASVSAPIPSEFTLTSLAFQSSAECSDSAIASCGIIPEQNSSYMNSPNSSPELHWAGAPAGAQSFAITLLDVTYGQPLWAIWNIPATESMLGAGLAGDALLAAPAGAQQCNATFADGDGYFGPDTPCNVYEFELFALSTAVFTPTKPEYVTLVRTELLDAGTTVLGRAKLAARSNYMLGCP